MSALLKLAIQHDDRNIEPSLSQALDVALYHGVRIENEVEIGEGYTLVPFEPLLEYFEPKWFNEVAAQQVNWR